MFDLVKVAKSGSEMFDMKCLKCSWYLKYVCMYPVDILYSLRGTVGPEVYRFIALFGDR